MNQKKNINKLSYFFSTKNLRFNKIKPYGVPLMFIKETALGNLSKNDALRCYSTKSYRLISDINHTALLALIQVSNYPDYLINLKQNAKFPVNANA